MNAVKKYILDASDPNGDRSMPSSLRLWREKVLDGILRGMLVFWLFAWVGGVGSVLQSYREEAHLYERPALLAGAIIAGYTAVVVLMIVITVRRQAEFRFRVGILLFVYYILGASGLTLAGLSGDGRVFLFAFVTITAVLTDIRRSLGALILSVVTMAIIGWLLSSGWLHISIDQQANSTNPGSWLTGSVIFVLLGTAVIISMSYLIRSLDHNLIAVQNSEENSQSLLRLSKELEQARTYAQILEPIHVEVQTRMAYQNVWIYLSDGMKENLTLLTVQGYLTDLAEEKYKGFSVKGDRFIEELINATDVNIVVDAQIDPRTDKNIVGALGNRTIVHIPLMLTDRPLGFLGTGSFGDEGVILPDQKQIDYLSSMANHVAVAIERIQVLDKRKRVQEELEQRVQERTAELALANEQLKELDRLKSKFVSDVSHELRTPITNMNLYLSLLERGKPEKRSHYMQVLNQQFGRLGTLVEDILDLSRLERERPEFMFVPIDFNHVIEDVITAHQPRSEEAGLALISDLLPGLPPVLGVQEQLSQIATNLIANAINYTYVGEIKVTTSLDEKNNQVCLQIRDTGMGIKPKDLPHLFDRFYRATDVSQSNIPGTGLGLAIVQEIVNTHGGHIEVESTVGEGSLFSVWLPIETGE